MESVIKWQTGEPKEEGEYLVQLKYGHIRIINWEKFNDYYNWTFFSREIIAWCKLSDIEPYKEEKKMKGKLKRRKWYNTLSTKPDVNCGLIVMTDMGYIFEAIYEDGVYKTSFVENHKVYFIEYSNQDSLVKFMQV